MNCRLNTVALLEILSIVRRHGLIHDNNNVPIEKIHVKSLRCGASKDIAVSSRVDYLQGLPQQNYIEISRRRTSLKGQDGFIESFSKEITLVLFASKSLHVNFF